MHIAIIDLGSTSARMDIVRLSTGAPPTVVYQLREAVRLSEGMGMEKTLKPYAIQRTVVVLQKFRQVMDAFNVERVHAVATAALRTAQNPQEILAPAADLGIDITVIDGEQEAYYDYCAVMSERQERNCVILDIGGASNEIIWVRDGQCEATACLPFGAVNLTERFLKHDPILPEELQSAIDAYTAALTTLPWLEGAKGLPVIGLGGTLHAMVTMMGNQVDGAVLEQTFRTISAATVAQRREMPHMDIPRADIIVGGMLPAYVVMKTLQSPYLLGCAAGLREGILYDLTK